MHHNALKLSKMATGGPLHYVGNRNLSLADISGHMQITTDWLVEHFSIILEHLKGRKFTRCYEPFCGSATWTFAAMQLDIAEEYIINDSDAVLINLFQCMKEDPHRVKIAYSQLFEEYNNTSSKKDFFIKTIENYNHADLSTKTLLLSFIINYSWNGMIFHDGIGNIVYRDWNVKGYIIDGYLEEATLSLNQYFEEVDKVSLLLNTHRVRLQSGDFVQALSDMQEGDFIALNPPYPENITSRLGEVGLYREIYSRDILHEKVIQTLKKMDLGNIEYFMTYGFHNPETQQFVILDDKQQLRHFLRTLGHKDCIFRIGLDQMYFSPRISIPESLKSKIIEASFVLKNLNLSSKEALEIFQRVAER